MSKSDRITYLIGILVIGFLAWQAIGYLLPDKEEAWTGETLLEEVMSRSGGFENWQKVPSISFRKEFKLYKEDGSIEIDRNERHNYTYDEAVRREISWQNDTITYTLKQLDSQLEQYKAGILDTVPTAAQLRNKINAATFVLGLPYTLKDSGASLSYEGMDDFNSKEVHKLKVQFKDSEDIWTLYYDTTDFYWLGYWVKTSDHYSLVINEEMTVVNGFSLSRKRKSYRTDADRNSLYLRAEYFYDDYGISKNLTNDR